jgi:alkanesulfonate monooxygenase SsuD/methylene tetrahydromethanopterin reductase-like flavin-dependent oxidoreductase (luciferase family)
MELGINTLGGVSADRTTGVTPSEHERLRSVVEQGVLAEELGFAAFSVGEHHGDTTFVTSAPPVILAAIAARTQRIRLMTGVTLLPLLDPVRVAEDYSTVDVISGGRVAIVAGKGNFANASRLLVGENEPDRAALLREHLELLLEILDSGHVESWSGDHRPALVDAYVTPRPVQQRLPVWLGATRNLDSIELAARHGLPVLVAGFKLGTYADFAEHYRQSFADAGHEPSAARIASLSTVVVSHDDVRVRREYQAYWERTVSAAARRDARTQRVAAQSFEDLAGPNGQILIGTPEYVAERLIATHRDLGHDLHFLQVDNGLGAEATADAMRLIAEEVVPHVLNETAGVVTTH